MNTEPINKLIYSKALENVKGEKKD